MSELDELLGGALKRSAVSGDPTGVADAIRSRVDAGDIGTPAQSSGFGGLLPAVLKWVPWAGMVVVAGIAGGALGVSGVFTPDSAAASVYVAMEYSVEGLACPAGAPVVLLEPGQRVLAVQRDEDSGYLAIRDPYQLDRTVWVPAASVVVDADQAAPSSLPIGGCPEPTISVVPEVVVPVPVPEEAAAPAPTKKPAPAPAPVDNAPTIALGKFSPQPVYGIQANICPTETFITVTANDDRGISGVSGSTSFSGSTITLVSHSGSSWVFSFKTTYAGTSNGTTSANVTFTATDTGGKSASATTTLSVRGGNYMNCYLG